MESSSYFKNLVITEQDGILYISISALDIKTNDYVEYNFTADSQEEADTKIEQFKKDYIEVQSESSEKTKKPTENDKKPSEKTKKPSENDKKPSENDKKPSENDKKPNENDKKPTENGESEK